MEVENILLETIRKLSHTEGSFVENTHGFAMKDIVNSMRDVELQSQHDMGDAIKYYGHMVNHPLGDCIWFWFESPDWTWKKLCGRAGWMVISRSDLKLIDFFLEIMN